MRHVVVLALAALILGPVGCQSEPDPRALVVKAVKAQGGGKNLGEAAGATRVTFEGIDHSRGGIKYTAVFRTQPPDRVRMTYHFQGDAPYTLTFVRNGDKAWEHVNGETEEVGEQQLARIKKLMHADRVVELVPLLSDRGFVLSYLGEFKVNDQSTLGVMVSYKDQPKVRLEFDKAKGVLRKVELRFPDFSTEEVVYSETYTDYQEVKPGAADERILEAAKLPSDGASLLALLRKQILSDADRKEIQELIGKLGHRSFQIRKKASAALVARGAPALPWLHRAMKSEDPEVARRAERCAGRIEKTAGAGVLAAAVRLLSLRKPKGAAEVLLAYFPCAADEAVAREVKNALFELAVRDGKPEPVLVKAMAGPEPLRSLAAAALGRDAGAARRQPGRRLLLHGVKWPTKGILSRDRTTLFEWKITDIQFYNKLDDSLFAKP
jgi:hypothetical protein